jgi:hypothetical protein
MARLVTLALALLGVVAPAPADDPEVPDVHPRRRHSGLGRQGVPAGEGAGQALSLPAHDQSETSL